MHCATRKSGIGLTSGWRFDVFVKICKSMFEMSYKMLYFAKSKWYNWSHDAIHSITSARSVEIMDVCYNKLFKLLIDKGMKKTEFRNVIGMSQSTLAKLSNNEKVSMDIIIKICRTLNCTVDEILDIMPEKDSEPEKTVI